MANVLDIDPKNLGHEFDRQWLLFREQKTHTFLVQYALKRLHEQQNLLATASLNDVQKLQGQIHETQLLLKLLCSSNVYSELKSLLQHLEKK